MGYNQPGGARSHPWRSSAGRVTLTSVEASEPPAVERASGSSFYNAMRILPRAQREAMYEIYSFCRQVDDIADSSGPRAARRQALDQWRADIDALYVGRQVPRTRGLMEAMRRFKLRREDFHAIIDGMEMDVVADIRAPDEATLDSYCDRVASAVGRLSVRVFGMGEADGIALAHHLGRALQLTNILRDLDEDAALGRLYLPAELLQAKGIAVAEPAAVLESSALAAVCGQIADRARRHFADADEIMVRNPRRTVRAPRIMGEAYRLILDALVVRGWSAPRQPIRLSRPRLLWIIMRNAFF
ncbi:MAG: presqualene diphosphate synthase HpnD [Hyphomicrobiales bacterium]|nr:presqualene diphosphate synthase HpnD [Hyphomicrobiales bacterium]